MKRIGFLIIMMLLAACGSETAVSPTSVPATEAPPTAAAPTEAAEPAPPTAVATEAAAEPAVATEPPAATDVPATATADAPLLVSGRTADGAYFLGNPDAPVTLIDYSDFL